jgi:glycosyltransferase involved in cell wall biosynthesis
MKILFITDLYPIYDYEIDTPKTLHNFVIEWIKQEHTVDVIRPNFIFNAVLRGKKLSPKGFYKYKNVKIFNVNYFTPFLFDYLKKIPKVFDFKSYDVIVAHMPSGIIFADKLSERFSIPLICAVHVSDIEVLTKPVYKLHFKLKLQKAYKNSKKIACRSFVLQKKFKELMPELAEKTFVATSGVKFSEIIPLNTSQILLKKVLTCANLIKRKNIDKLILAVKDLKDFSLTVIGDGKEFTRLNALGGEDVKFLGRLAQKDVLKEMQKADIFVLPSVNETFGMVYLEAMASDCITVCTKNDGIDGIIKDGENGFLCEANVESIKKTLLKIRESEKINQIIRNGRKTVEEYSPENCAENYLKNLI